MMPLEQSTHGEEISIDENPDGDERLSDETPDGPDGEQPLIDETPEELAAHSRTLRNSVISLAVFFALIVALLLSVPGLHSVEQDIYHASSQWVAAGVGLELLSCASYV